MRKFIQCSHESGETPTEIALNKGYQYSATILQDPNKPTISFQNRWNGTSDQQKAQLLREDNGWALQEAYLFSDEGFVRQLFLHAVRFGAKLSTRIQRDDFLLIRMMIHKPTMRPLVEEILAAGFSQFDAKALLEFGSKYLARDYLNLAEKRGDWQQAKTKYREHNKHFVADCKDKIFEIFLGVLFAKLTPELMKKEELVAKLNQFIDRYFIWYPDSQALTKAVLIDMKMTEYFQPQKSSSSQSSLAESYRSYIRLGGPVMATNIDYFITRIYRCLVDHKHLRSSNLLLELLLNSKFRVKDN